MNSSGAAILWAVTAQVSLERNTPSWEKGESLMLKRILGGLFLGAFVGAVVYEILDREKPEMVEKVKGWFVPEEDLLEPEEVLAE